LDKLDKEILRILSENSRKSYRDIAKELDTATQTISNRVKHLIEKGVIKNFSININYEAINYDITAIIEVRIAKGKLLEVEKEIANIPNIFGVYDITGEYDALVLLRSQKREELNSIIKNMLKNDDIIRTNTHLVLNSIKDNHKIEDLHTLITTKDT